jgi:hypothetical protein
MVMFVEFCNKTKKWLFLIDQKWSQYLYIDDVYKLRIQKINTNKFARLKFQKDIQRWNVDLLDVPYLRGH